jgi:hypothetical protein
VFPFTPARDESRVPKPSEPLRYGRNPLAQSFGDVADTGFMSAQDFHQSQAPFISDRSQHANGLLETSIAEVWFC